MRKEMCTGLQGRGSEHYLWCIMIHSPLINLGSYTWSRPNSTDWSRSQSIYSFVEPAYIIIFYLEQSCSWSTTSWLRKAWLSATLLCRVCKVCHWCSKLFHYIYSWYRYYETDNALRSHWRGKVHKRRCKQLREPAYTIEEAEQAAGLGREGKRSTREQVIDISEIAVATPAWNPRVL